VLLLWLLSKRRQRSAVMAHQPIESKPTADPPLEFKTILRSTPVMPTPESCAEWLQVVDPSAASDCNRREWRRQALLLGLGGATVEPWLKPIVHKVAAGRFGELESDMLHFIDNSVESGDIVFDI